MPKYLVGVSFQPPAESPAILRDSAEWTLKVRVFHKAEITMTDDKNL